MKIRVLNIKYCKQKWIKEHSIAPCSKILKNIDNFPFLLLGKKKKKKRWTYSEFHVLCPLELDGVTESNMDPSTLQYINIRTWI